MSLTETLPVYRDTYRLIQLIYLRTRDFSREYKYTLGQDMKRDSGYVGEKHLSRQPFGVQTSMAGRVLRY